MIKLLLFAPCEKVIVGEGGQSSAIGIVEQVSVGVVTTLQAESMVPFRWNILTLWHREQEIDNPIKYQSRMIVLRPDGVQAMQADVEFEVSNQFANFRQVADIPFFPAGLPGPYLLKLFLRKEGEEEQEITSFPITVVHKAEEVEIKEPKDEKQKA